MKIAKEGNDSVQTATRRSTPTPRPPSRPAAEAQNAVPVTSGAVPPSFSADADTPAKARTHAGPVIHHPPSAAVAPRAVTAAVSSTTTMGTRAGA
ncbi:hypothetical protein Ssi03_51160 [Sphaerisporangium siamense]|nr:hypothetical protein Ssi03_51160 [Sphaerisporangium siamense]